MTFDRADLMRALAHPTRLALLEVLQLHESLTATEASELLGVTPTNCAFHLRAMGRYGLVEEVGQGPGRRRPWRLVATSLGFSDVQPDEKSTIAARALSDVIIDQWLSRIRRVQADRHHEPPEWQEVFGGSHSIVFGTRAEIEEMMADLRKVLDRYDSRLRHNRGRPADGRAVELLLFAQPYMGDHIATP
jgi:DNA-binding transcriptional ArsR family regulator